METRFQQNVQDADFSFVKAEEEILGFWEQQKVFEQTLDKTRDKAPYIFYDGPPFATGLPHHGHLVGSTLKDIIPRYQTMKGKFVDRRFGWDCHGLPIEHEIDKKLKMSAHEALEKLGVKQYNDECRGIVQTYTKEWQKTIKRLGRWVSFERDYKTMDPDFMESVWWVFKQLWDKGLVYKSKKVMPFSTALGTVLSNFEASSNYKDVQDPAITVLFKLNDSKHHIAAWTTTPWTLPSNLGLCVNEELDYHLIQDHDKSLTYYIAAARLSAYEKKRNLEIIETIKGSELKGKTYTPLFPYFAKLAQEGCFQIFADDYVSTDNGTGIVHLAPAFGEDDNRVMAAHGVTEMVCPVDNQGQFDSEVSDYTGQYVKDADKPIIAHLKNQGLLYEHGNLVHSYPFCPRSDTPLIYKAIPSWYISVETIKKRLMAANQEVNWVPGHLKDGRFGKWIANARDWAISRNRVWGTPLPIWFNQEADDYICVGSFAELKEISGVHLDDLHREHVDPIEFSIKGKPGSYKRVREVLDCWFESGSMPYAQLHYPFEQEDVFKQGFPAEFIAEGLDQTRGWFYTLMVLSTALYDKPAFKNVIVNGLVLAKDGKKMSKSLRNFTPPDDLMDKHGADALRLFLINSGLVKAEDLKFTDDGVKDMVRRVLLPWLNSYKFFKTYASVDEWKPQTAEFRPEHILDQWVLSKLQTLIKNVNQEMDAYRLYNVVPSLFEFIDDLTNWYIRLNRKRFWTEDKGSDIGADKHQAYQTLFTTLVEVSKLMAPLTPFLAEFIYLDIQAFGKQEASVHLCSYPQVDESYRTPLLEEAVKKVQEVILLGRQKRNQEKVKVKIPLKELVIIHRNQELLDEIGKLESTIQTELNVKSIKYDTSEESYIRFFAKPNSPVLGKKLGKAFGPVRKAIEALSSQQLQALEQNGSIEVEGHALNTEEILLFREPLEGTDASSNRHISINLSCALDAELLAEGHAREFVNRIQKTRKDLNFKVGDRIKITIDAGEDFQAILKKHLEYIKSEVLAQEITFNTIGAELPHSFEISEHQFSLDIEKLS